MARLQANTRIYGAAYIDSTLALSGNADLSGGNVTIGTGNASVGAMFTVATGNLYTTSPTITITSPTTFGGAPATANVSIGVISVSITAGGSGYYVGNVLTAVGNASIVSNAVFTVTSTSATPGAITGLAITSPGVYYFANTNPMTTTLTGSGGGTGAAFTTTYGINTPVVTYGGTGYTEQPQAVFTGGGGSGAFAQVWVGPTPSAATVRFMNNDRLTFAGPGGTAFEIRNPAFSTGASNSVYAAPTVFTNAGYVSYSIGDSGGGVSLISRGSGAGVSVAQGGGVTITNFPYVTNAVNYLNLQAAATGFYPTISAQGSDTNISLQLTPKGTGIVSSAAALQINSYGTSQIALNASGNYYGVIGTPTGSSQLWGLGWGNSGYFGGQALTWGNVGNVKLPAGIASTGTSTGALTIPYAGGIGVTGNVNIGGTTSIAANLNINGSFSMNGTNNYATIPYSTTYFDWFTTSVDYTLECWIYPLTYTGWSNLGGIPASLGSMAANGSNNNWSFGINTTGVVTFYYYNGVTTYINGTGVAPLNSWSHIAMTKTNNGVTLFINGVLQTNSANTAIVGSPQTGTPITIGAYAGNYPNGFITDIRIVKGAAVYYGNYTVPTAPLTTTQSASANILAISSNVTLLLTAASAANLLVDSSSINNTVSNFGLNYSGNSPFYTGTIPSTSTTTGALVITGGTGISGNLNVGGNLVSTSTIVNTPGTNLLPLNTTWGNPWNNTGMTLTLSQLDPFGGNNAVLLNDGTTTGQHFSYVYVNNTVGAPYTFSFYAKSSGTANPAAYMAIYYYNPNVGIIFNMSTGAYSSTIGGTALSFSSTNVGNGWWRFTLTQWGYLPTNNAWEICMVNSTGTSFGGTGGSYTGTNQTVLIYAPQLEYGYTALPPVINTTSSAIYNNPTIKFSNTASQISMDINSNIVVTSANIVLNGNVLGNAMPGGIITSSALGYIGLPQNTQNSNYTLLLSDQGKSIYYTANANITIPTNAVTPFPVGSTITITTAALTSVNVTVATDTLYLAGVGSQGNRLVSPYGLATLTKVTPTSWYIGGTGVS